MSSISSSVRVRWDGHALGTRPSLVAAAALTLLACTNTISGAPPVPEGDATPGGTSGTANTGGSSAGGTGSAATAGTTTTGGAAGTAGSGGAPEPPAEPSATATLARLSQVQLANTLSDLLGIGVGNVDDELTKDAVLRFDNQADALFVGDSLRVELQALAERLAKQVVEDPATVARLVPAAAPSDAAGRGRAFIESFGTRAFRRALTSTEADEYAALFAQGPMLTSGRGAFEAGMQVTLEAFLQSPYFLYRTAFGSAVVDGKARLTSDEIASMLSYSLANTMPDAELFERAASGALADPASIASQASRLLATERGEAATDHFFFQLFGLGAFDMIRKDPAVAPEYSTTTGQAMREESRRFLSFVFSQGGGVREILTSPVSFVNRETAPLYGLPPPADWTRVSLPAAERPGILTRLGFLAFYGKDALQDSIRRGVYVNGRILCVEMRAPDDIAIPALPPNENAVTNREVVDSFTGNGTCGAGCHAAYINPAGFAFENFDGLGRYRMTENGVPVDSSGVYEFASGEASYANLSEFTELLAGQPQVHTCYAEQLLSSLFARVPDAADKQLARRLSERSLAERLSTEALMLALVSEPAFLNRIPEVQ